MVFVAKHTIEQINPKKTFNIFSVAAAASKDKIQTK
jgi:hypothetical protein